jgi:hypothetical protein
MLTPEDPERTLTPHMENGRAAVEVPPFAAYAILVVN